MTPRRTFYRTDLLDGWAVWTEVSESDAGWLVELVPTLDGVPADSLSSAHDDPFAVHRTLSAALGCSRRAILRLFLERED